MVCSVYRTLNAFSSVPVKYYGTRIIADPNLLLKKEQGWIVTNF